MNASRYFPEYSDGTMNAVLEFVKKATQSFDESHGFDHAHNVAMRCADIMYNDPHVYAYIEAYPDLSTIIMICAYLHDVRDHKYESISVSETELYDFIRSIAEPYFEPIVQIIHDVSYSKEVKGLTLESALHEPFEIALIVVRDADRIEAIGYKGVERCFLYTKESGGIVPDDAIKHIHEKLIRLLPMNYIKSLRGREIALPLHREMCAYLRDMGETIPEDLIL